jgi:hypothetical protein
VNGWRSKRSAMLTMASTWRPAVIS